MIQTGPALTSPAMHPANISMHSALDSSGELLPATVKRRRISASPCAMDVAVPDAVKGRVDEVFLLTALSKLFDPIAMLKKWNRVLSLLMLGLV
jgi:hypothetical protein